MLTGDLLWNDRDIALTVDDLDVDGEGGAGAEKAFLQELHEGGTAYHGARQCSSGGGQRSGRPGAREAMQRLSTMNEYRVGLVWSCSR